ncbi:hypothetical protein [Streptomyces sp. NBC_01207]|uniref:hypothetical protein n=1 Tax=Streptomyces sp. NBC_01207 TaxID=2903772 RepID=UPI002E14FADD|nr:hypothetical protein OG457_11220 [Streptomyces sp. NBC_01207]
MGSDDLNLPTDGGNALMTVALVLQRDATPQMRHQNGFVARREDLHRVIDGQEIRRGLEEAHQRHEEGPDSRPDRDIWQLVISRQKILGRTGIERPIRRMIATECDGDFNERSVIRREEPFERRTDQWNCSLNGIKGEGR